MAKSRGTILGVDDEPAIHELFGFYMANMGYVYESALTVADGVAKAAAAQPDLIILDYILAEKMTGMDVLRKLREIESLKTVPVVFLSGNLEQKLLDEARKLGVSHFLKKPISLPKLTMTVQSLIKKS